MQALAALREFLAFKVGDISKGLSDTQITQLGEVQYNSNIQGIVMAAISASDIAGDLSEDEDFLAAVASAVKTKLGGSMLSKVDVQSACSDALADSAPSIVETALDKKISDTRLETAVTSGIESKRTALKSDTATVMDNMQSKVETWSKTGAINGIRASADEIKSDVKSGISEKQSDFTNWAKAGASNAITAKRPDIKSDTSEAVLAAFASANFKTGVLDTIGSEEGLNTMKRVSSFCDLATNETVRTAINSAYSQYAIALANAKSQFGDIVDSIINQSIKLNEATVQYQSLLIAAKEAAEKLNNTVELFQAANLSAERYASLVTDVLSVAQLQKAVQDNILNMNASIRQLYESWSKDRDKLYDTMEDVRKIQDVNSKIDIAYKAILSLTSVTERVQEGLKMRTPDIKY